MACGGKEKQDVPAFGLKLPAVALSYREKFSEGQGEEGKHPAENLMLTGVQSEKGPGRYVHRYEAYWHGFC